MITPDYVRTMAAYNRWQNDNLYSSAEQLSDAERKTNRGAFFGSIHATLNHLLWADKIWMHRFAGWDHPRAQDIQNSVHECERWEDLKSDRIKLDTDLVNWADGLDVEALKGMLTWYSKAAGRELIKPRSLLITHLFNHQTHHRGQVHVMLTAVGCKPGDTDLPFMPD